MHGFRRPNSAPGTGRTTTYFTSVFELRLHACAPATVTPRSAQLQQQAKVPDLEKKNLELPVESCVGDLGLVQQDKISKASSLTFQGRAA